MMLVQALHYPFRGKGSFCSLLILTPVQLLPVVGQVMLLGYGFDIVRAVSAGQTSLPPLRWRATLSNGCRLLLAGFVYLLPILLAIAMVEASSVGSRGGSGNLGNLGILVAVGFPLLLVIGSVAVRRTSSSAVRRPHVPGNSFRLLLTGLLPIVMTLLVILLLRSLVSSSGIDTGNPNGLSIVLFSFLAFLVFLIGSALSLGAVRYALENKGLFAATTNAKLLLKKPALTAMLLLNILLLDGIAVLATSVGLVLFLLPGLFALVVCSLALRFPLSYDRSIIILLNEHERRRDSMQITIIAGGSRGDVQPYVALGKGLQEAGHRVHLLTFEDFETLVTDHGLAFFTTGGSAEAVARDMQTLSEQGNMLKILSQMRRASEKQAVQATIKGLVACQGSDLILGGLSGLFSGQALSEKLSIPMRLAYLVPFTPTSAFPSVLTPLPQTPLTHWMNKPSHRVAQQTMWQSFRSADNKARAEVLHVPLASFWGPFSSLRHQKQPILYGYSSHVLPHPGDWDDAQHVTGYWFLEPPPGWEPPADLLQFLQAGPPPIYIGFGSMSSRKPEEAADLVLQALARTGQRGVLYEGWGGLRKEQLPETVYMTRSIPHTWLFPRMAAVVHHGGVGTTAAGLAAGVPSIIIPFFADQPFWGQCVYELGVGPRPIVRKRLTVDNLTEAIRHAVSDEAMQQKASALGTRIRTEHGIARAVTLIEQMSREGF